MYLARALANAHLQNYRAAIMDISDAVDIGGVDIEFSLKLRAYCFSKLG